MHPILFEIGGFPVYTYGLLLAAAYLLGLQFALVRGRARGLDPNRIMDLGIWIIVSALVGAKLMLVFVEWDSFQWTWQSFVNLFRSAGVFYGGLIAAVSVALWYLWRHRMPMWTVTDVFAPGIALGHVIGRLGCRLGLAAIRQRFHLRRHRQHPGHLDHFNRLGQIGQRLGLHRLVERDGWWRRALRGAALQRQCRGCNHQHESVTAERQVHGLAPSEASSSRLHDRPLT